MERVDEPVNKPGGDDLGVQLETHQGRLYNIVLRMLGDRDDAADVTQEAMLKIVEHYASFKHDCQLLTWMTRIAMNLAISHLRKRKNRPALSLDTGDRDQAWALRQNLADNREPDPAQSVQLDEERQLLARALLGVEQTLRAVLVLRDIQEMDYQQIAQTISVPVGTVKSRLFRARLALREELAKLDADRHAQPEVSDG